LRFERAERRREQLRNLHGPSIVKGEMPHYEVADAKSIERPEWTPDPTWLVRADSGLLVAKDKYARPTHMARAEFVQAKNGRHLSPTRVRGETRPVKRPAILRVNCLDQCLYHLACMVTSWTGTRVMFVFALTSFMTGYMKIEDTVTVTVTQSRWDYWTSYAQTKAYDIAIAGLLKLFYDYFISFIAMTTFGSLFALIPCCWHCRTLRQQNSKLDAIQQRQAAAVAAAPKPARVPSDEEVKEMRWTENQLKRFLSIEEHDRMAALKSGVSGVVLNRAKSLDAIGKVEAARMATVQKVFGRKFGRPSVVLNDGHQPGVHKKKDVQRPRLARIATWIREKVSGKRCDPRFAVKKGDLPLAPPTPIEFVVDERPVPQRPVLIDPSAPAQYEPLEA